MKKNILVREAAVAGQFYDDDPLTLAEQIQKFLSEARKKGAEKKKVYAIIVPHAGYLYSGQTAAQAFALIENFSYKRAIIIAPSHRYGFSGLAYGDFDKFSTPLGEIDTDKDFIAKIAGQSHFIQKIERAHYGEHSLEVELPLLQRTQKKIKIVPFICGSINDNIVEEISRVSYSFINDENIWIISSDFTHYGHAFGYTPFSSGNTIEKIKKLDFGAIDKILNLDYEGFGDYVDDTGATICGAAPIKILLKTLQTAQAKSGIKIKSKLVAYANSADIAGDTSHCVSYASIAFTE